MLKAKRQSARTVTVPAPIGGWNTRDPLSTMQPTDAVVIDNWFCTPTALRSRKGYTDWATGIAGNVQTIFDYDLPSGTESLFAAADNAGACAIYDCSTKGAVGAAVVSGLTSAKFQYAHVTNSGGTFIILVNGADSLIIYNGTTWQSVTGVSAPFAITGITTSSLSDVHLHKRRVWFIEKGSMRGWYLGVDAVAGAATQFDFGPIFTRGGHVQKIETWSLDAGYGMDDHFAVITSAGEVAIYRGIDPSTADTWALVGVYYVGSPIGSKCTCKYGGDVLLLNKDGLIPLSKALMSSRVSTRMVLTDKIQNRVATDTTTYGTNFGWDVILYPPQNMLMINVPISATQSYQYVMNTISGGWSRWTGIPAQCWYFANETLWFGTAGKVCRAWDSGADAGSAIITDLLPAFSAFGSVSQIKRWTMARISMGSDNTFAYATKLSVDFDLVTIGNAPTSTSPIAAGGIWDTAKWDAATWGGDISPFARWSYIGGMGHYGANRVRTSSNVADIRYYATDYVYEAGGVL